MNVRRFSPLLLLALLLGIGSLAFCVFVVLFRQPPAPAETDEDDTGAPTQVAGNAGQGRRFDNSFGSLAALVPQGGSTPVTATPAAALAGSAAAEVGSAAIIPQAVAADGAAVHGEQFRDLNWIKAQGSAYTLQVLGAHDEASVRQFIAIQPDHDQFRYIEVMEGGSPWFVVVYGSFDTRDEALAAAGSIEGLSSRPFVRQFSAYVTAPIAPGSAAPAAASQASPAG